MINNIDENKRKEMRDSSVLGLPDNPKAHGISGADVKKAMVQPFIGVSENEDANTNKTSIVEEVNRIVEEANAEIGEINKGSEELKSKIESVEEQIKETEDAINEVSNKIAEAIQASEEAKDSASIAKEYSDEAMVSAESVKKIIEGAPESLDTLKEIADALNNDENLATNLLNEIAKKLSINGGTLLGNLQLGKGEFPAEEQNGATVSPENYNYKLILFAPTANPNHGDSQWSVIDINNPGEGNQFLKVGITGTGIGENATRYGQFEYWSGNTSPDSAKNNKTTKLQFTEKGINVISDTAEGLTVVRNGANARLFAGFAYGSQTIAQLKAIWDDGGSSGLIIKKDGLYQASSSTDNEGAKLATKDDLPTSLSDSHIKENASLYISDHDIQDMLDTYNDTAFLDGNGNTGLVAVNYAGLYEYNDGMLGRIYSELNPPPSSGGGTDIDTSQFVQKSGDTMTGGLTVKTSTNGQIDISGNSVECKDVITKNGTSTEYRISLGMNSASDLAYYPEPYIKIRCGTDNNGYYFYPHRYLLQYINSSWQKTNITFYTSGNKSELLNTVYPVGSIYMSTNNKSPASFIGGSWTQIQDKFLLSAGSTYTAGSEGGSATHTLTLNEMPAHQHEVPYSEDGNNQGWQQSGYIYLEGRCDNTKSDGCWFYSNDTGGNLPHNNMPPYLTVYMWQRVS